MQPRASGEFIAHARKCMNFKLAHILMAKSRMLALFWSGPNSNPLPSASTSDLSESDAAAGSSGVYTDHESGGTDCESD